MIGFNCYPVNRFFVWAFRAHLNLSFCWGYPLQSPRMAGIFAPIPLPVNGKAIFSKGSKNSVLRFGVSLIFPYFCHPFF
jgi:hypothetical protein